MNRGILGGLAVLGGLAAATGAGASGYAVREQSALTQGAAQAGAAARGDDPSILFFNPASMGFLSGTNVTSVGSGIFPRAEAEAGSGSRTAVFGGTPITGTLGNDSAYDAFVPAFYATHAVSERLSFGLGVTSPFGLVTKYPSDFIGRYHALTSSLRTINVTPAVSMRPVPEFSLGLGLQIQYASARLSSATDLGGLGASNPLLFAAGFRPGNRDGLATVEGDDIAAGWQIGAQWEPIAGTRIGAAFRSALFHTLRGDAEFERTPVGLTGNILVQDTGARAKLTTPESATFGISQRLGDRFTLLAGAEWTNWSRFRELRVDFDNGRPPTVTDQRWRDSVFLNIGGEYRATDAITLRAGFAYDQTPVREATRTPRIPDNDRTWLSAGVTWQATPNVALTAAYTHVFAETSRVQLRDRGPGTSDFGRGNLNLTYDANVHIVSVQARLSF